MIQTPKVLNHNIQTVTEITPGYREKSLVPLSPLITLSSQRRTAVKPNDKKAAGRTSLLTTDMLRYHKTGAALSGGAGLRTGRHLSASLQIVFSKLLSRKRRQICRSYVKHGLCSAHPLLIHSVCRACA